MIIRDYEDADELQWLRCRVVSFLDSSYYNDVLTRHEKYENDFISLVAEEKGEIIGLIEVEIEKKSRRLVCCFQKQTGRCNLAFGCIA